MNSYDTKSWAWEAQVNALKSELEAQATEIERLRAELHTASDMNAVYEGRLQEKEAEIERLQAALESKKT